MDLMERYMAAIRRNLPAARADDIAAEIAEDLESRREDREAALGRPLTRDEVGAMLRSFGHPLVVAARFRSHQYLIGPEVYPFYLFVMKIALALGAALVVGVAIVGLALGDSNLVRAVAQAAEGLLSYGLFAIAVVTIIFAVLERAGFPAGHLARWTPEQLPDPLDKPQSQWESAAEVGLGLAFLLWWTGVVRIPQLWGAQAPIEAAPVWDRFYLPILLLLSAQLLVNLVKWLRPRWRTAIGIATIATSVAALVVIGGLFQADGWVVATAAGSPEVTDSVNLAIKIALVVTAIMMTLQALGEIWKLIQRRRRSAA
jgi:hypothetical protein